MNDEKKDIRLLQKKIEQYDKNVQNFINMVKHKREESYRIIKQYGVKPEDYIQDKSFVQDCSWVDIEKLAEHKATILLTETILSTFQPLMVME